MDKVDDDVDDGDDNDDVGADGAQNRYQSLAVQFQTSLSNNALMMLYNDEDDNDMQLRTNQIWKTDESESGLTV